MAACCSISCSSDTSEYYHANLGVGEPKLVIASSSAGQYGLAMYDLQGNFLRLLADYVPQNTIPRGLYALNSFEFLVAFDGTNVDTIGSYHLVDGEDIFINNANLNGNIFHVRQHPTHGTFVIETNVIESFDSRGQRVGAPRIGTTIGGCTLGTPRGMTFNSSGNLVVVNSANNDINVYDVSNPLNTACLVSNTSFAAVTPVAVLAHSDGFLYIATQGDDRIYRVNGDGTGVPVTVFNNIAFINNPTALVEMPDGSLLVASDGTDSVVNITTAGALVGSNYLFSDLFTNSISDMILLEEYP